MTAATGSYAEQTALAYAYQDWQLAERCASLYGGQFSGIADKAHEKLTRAALRCGHDLGSPSDTVATFAAKRVADFSLTTGRAA